MTFEEMKSLPPEEQKSIISRIRKSRNLGKTCNFASVYGVTFKTLSRNTGISLKEATKLIDSYWKRNWAVKAFEETLEVKDLSGYKYIKNPISGLYVILRTDKDKFSAVNQSTAVFVFDLWLKEVRKLGITVCYQCHDEMLFNVPKGEEDKYKDLLQKAMDNVNNILKLPVTVRMEAQFGDRYSDCH